MNTTFKACWNLAFSQTLSLWRAGSLNVLVFALMLAVSAITAVGFFTQRVESALNQQGGQLLGGDLVIQADHQIPQRYVTLAENHRLRALRAYEFPSMVVFGETNHLAEIKAVDTGFPMRGDLTIGPDSSAAGYSSRAIPAQGEVWLEPRLANLLNVKVGQTVELGESKLKVSAILLREPSRGGDMFGFAPRLMMNSADLAATGLIQYGSRVKYQLLLAGKPLDVERYQAQVTKQLARGERVQDVRNARPEIKSALDKAQQFLGLSAMISVILAMAAMLLASVPYIMQSLDTFALMRCFGASRQTVLSVLSLQTLQIAVLSGLVGAGFGFLAQAGLAHLASSLFLEQLPSVSLQPLGLGLIAAVALMFAVMLPHIWQMRNMSTVNILRRETFIQPMSGLARYLPAIVVLCIMVFWQAGNVKIALSTILALVVICALIASLAYALVKGIGRLFSTRANHWSAASLGVQGIKRRFALSTVQMVGFSMGLMVLMLLSFIRGDLIHNWQASLPADAPNRFIINIQPDQIAGIKNFFKQNSVKDATVFPMVRGRLTTINGRAVSGAQWQDDRAKRLAEREFNLSWAAEMQSDNRLVGGRWWTPQEHGKPYLSLEQDLAKTLGIKLGDQLQFNVAGQMLQVTVTSLRKVEWDTMRANFFAVTPPGLLEQYPANHISSFHLPGQADAALNKLVREYPNLTVIDVAALMVQVRGIMQRMSDAVQYVFMFSLVAGLAVLYAALVATQQERIQEATLIRVFGASQRQVTITYVTEFACIGLLSGIVAVVVANVLAGYLSLQILEIPFSFDLKTAVVMTVLAACLIPFAAWIGFKKYLKLPPKLILNSI